MFISISQITAWCLNAEDHNINFHGCKNSKVYNYNVPIPSIKNNVENINILCTHFTETFLQAHT